MEQQNNEEIDFLVFLEETKKYFAKYILSHNAHLSFYEFIDLYIKYKSQETIGDIKCK